MTSSSGWVRLVLALGVVATTAVGAGAPVGAQSATELEIKVALLYNFAKFVEWPAESLPPGGAFQVCVLGDQPFRMAFGSAVKGRTIDGHAVMASDVEPEGRLTACQVLYAPGLNSGSARALVKVSTGAPVFTVSDFDQFAELGGVANFFREGSRIRIAINVNAARQQRLQISSKLLAIATLVKTRHE